MKSIIIPKNFLKNPIDSTTSMIKKMDSGQTKQCTRSSARNCIRDLVAVWAESIYLSCKGNFYGTARLIREKLPHSDARQFIFWSEKFIICSKEGLVRIHWESRWCFGVFKVQNGEKVKKSFARVIVAFSIRRALFRRFLVFFQS